MGGGFGYSAEVLRDRLKTSARVLVFEPDKDLYKLFLEQRNSQDVLQDGPFEFIVGRESCRFLDEWGLDACQEIDEFRWLTGLAAYQIHGNLAENLRENFKISLRDRAANLLNHFKNGRLYFDDVLANLPYQNDPDVRYLFGQFKNVPLVIVSALPSLDRNIRELRGTENRCLILPGG